MTGESFIDVDFAQRSKLGQAVCGDTFLSRKLKEEGRIIAVLSDGLGSGIKASVLANLTTAMAIKYTSAFMDVRMTARTIMDTLPVCDVRKISYSTFTIIDLNSDGRARIIEHGNPPVILLRGGQEMDLDKTNITVEEHADRPITYAECRLQIEDRIVVVSDGVTQSGMGGPGMPLGWERPNLLQHVLDTVHAEPLISSQQLAQRLVDRACRNDAGAAKDDVTCAVVYFRRPRQLLVASGPPFARDRDAELANLVSSFPGRTAICGGTTATIVSRMLQREVTMDLTHLDPEVPPASQMDGVDLVTEGTLTLAKTADLLESSPRANRQPPNAAHRLAALMLESDLVQFVIGTRINDAHQDPNIPLELDLRRNIVRRLATLLESKYLKETTIRFI